MPAKLFTTFSILILVILLVMGLSALTGYYAEMPEQVGQGEASPSGEMLEESLSQSSLSLQGQGKLLPALDERVRL